MKIEFVNGKYVAKNAAGRVVAQSSSKYYLKRKLAQQEQVVEQPAEDNPAIKFPINQRFNFVERLVKMVGRGTTASAVVTGEGGLGKSHVVINSLKALGLQDMSDQDESFVVNTRKMFRVVKGFSTARGLYSILYENRKSIIVFDDCDSILKDEDAVNLLKGALDSYDKRIITWNSMRADDDMPRSFQFEGGVIFISNRSMNKIDQALRTRSMCVDLTMTLDQKIERMDVIMHESDFLPDVAIAFKKDALKLIQKHKTAAREVSLRTLIAVAKIRAEGDSDWEDLATYALTA